MKLIDEILADLEQAIERINTERDQDGLPSLPKVEIRLLGQFSLLADKKASRELPIAATMDLDALIQGESVVQEELRSILGKRGLALDDLSGEIWIPDGSRFLPYYRSSRIRCLYLDPISVLVSKAIKAREKNRLLVQNAIAVYGEKLLKEIRRHGGDPEYFVSDHDE